MRALSDRHQHADCRRHFDVPRQRRQGSHQHADPAGTVAKDDKEQNVLTPAGPVLFYVADAKTPDVYRLAPGSF
jgi:hypothetical protein